MVTLATQYMIHHYIIIILELCFEYLFFLYFSLMKNSYFDNYYYIIFSYLL